MILKIFRNGLGYIFIFVSLFIPIKKLTRTEKEQSVVDKETASLSLYQFYPCPFCLKTRRAIKRLGLNITTRDATKDPARTELLSGGGQIKVPCLRIETNEKDIWLYESMDIIAYLEQHYTQSTEA